MCPICFEGFDYGLANTTRPSDNCNDNHCDKFRLAHALVFCKKRIRADLVSRTCEDLGRGCGVGWNG